MLSNRKQSFHLWPESDTPPCHPEKNIPTLRFIPVKKIDMKKSPSRAGCGRASKHQGRQMSQKEPHITLEDSDQHDLQSSDPNNQFSPLESSEVGSKDTSPYPKPGNPEGDEMNL